MIYISRCYGVCYLQCKDTLLSDEFDSPLSILRPPYISFGFCCELCIQSVHGHQSETQLKGMIFPVRHIAYVSLLSVQNWKSCQAYLAFSRVFSEPELRSMFLAKSGTQKIYKQLHCKHFLWIR